MVFFLLLSLFIEVHASGQIEGKIVGVADGDTFTLLTADKTQVKVRLHGIDCPEKRQGWGTRAKQHASDLVFGKSVTVRVVDTDRYGRTVGEVLLEDGTSVNKAMVRDGFAWWYRRYAPKDVELGQLEAEARAAGRGLWSGENPVPPWEWRRGKRNAGGLNSSTMEKSTSIPKDSTDCPFWINSGSGVRHKPSCKWYQNTKNGRCETEKVGKACGVCGG
jgi:endonuclease YncB( thermonuclease family)